MQLLDDEIHLEQPFDGSRLVDEFEDRVVRLVVFSGTADKDVREVTQVTLGALRN